MPHIHCGCVRRREPTCRPESRFDGKQEKITRPAAAAIVEPLCGTLCARFISREYGLLLLKTSENRRVENSAGERRVVVRDLPPVTSPSSAGRFRFFGLGGRIGALVLCRWSEARKSPVNEGLLTVTLWVVSPLLRLSRFNPLLFQC